MFIIVSICFALRQVILAASSTLPTADLSCPEYRHLAVHVILVQTSVVAHSKVLPSDCESTFIATHSFAFLLLSHYHCSYVWRWTEQEVKGHSPLREVFLCHLPENVLESSHIGDQVSCKKDWFPLWMCYVFFIHSRRYKYFWIAFSWLPLKWKFVCINGTYLIPASHNDILCFIIFFFFSMLDFRMYAVSRLPWLPIWCEETVILRHAQWLSLLSWGGSFNRDRMPEDKINITFILKFKSQSQTIFRHFMYT